MNRLKIFAIALFMAFTGGLQAQPKATVAPRETFNNPILPGFHPDPSICRVGDDYYLVNSSFTWYPGIPIYHSKDLVNWELIGHAIDRPDMVNLDGLDDNNGIWAVTIREHDGLFYLITTCNKAGGNFYLTAKDPAGPWSDPIWLPDAPGIDPSLFWDDDGRCYYTGNTWDFKKDWPSQCAVWMQELDLKQQKLVGERKLLAYGHANNAAFAEGPHIYKIDGKYILLMAEGGSSPNHAVTVFQSDKLWGPYVAGKVNPVITHRHLGKDYPIQGLGHADLVQTPQGDWWSVLLGFRMLDGYDPLARETFLCQVDFEDGMPIYNKGEGKVLLEQQRPDLPWTPVKPPVTQDEFEGDSLAATWYSVRIPNKKSISLSDGQLHVKLEPEVIDSLGTSAMLLQKTRDHRFTASTKLEFKLNANNEEAGMVYYRTANAYYSLMCNSQGVALYRKDLGKKELIQQLPYQGEEVYLQLDVDGLDVQFSFGASPDQLQAIGGMQSASVISSNKLNKFNGAGVGVYATSQGKASTHIARYDWFRYQGMDKK